MAEKPSRTERQPIVTVMGHIDHGKSSLLDYIRKTNIVAKEAGGITQHIAAYEAEHESAGVKRRITFIDTPGHEAFREMRKRGAKVADVVILVISSEDGVKPQTLEAWKAITEAGVAFIVAFTKIDKPNANLERVKGSTLEHGLYLESLGGDVPWVAVSAKTGEGIDELLDLVLLTADLKGLPADPNADPEGIVIESNRDQKKGVSATLIVRNGTIHKGAFVVAGAAFAPTRILENFAGKAVDAIVCGSPARVIGFTDLPSVGDLISVAPTKREAEERAKQNAAGMAANAGIAEGEDREVIPLVIKADVSGTIEAIEHEIGKIPAERTVVRILSKNVGPVTEGDVKLLAGAARGIIVGFNVGVDARAKELAERTNVSIATFSIIYELAKWLEEAILDRTPKVTTEEASGTAKILKVFGATGTKRVFGGRVESGTLSHDGAIRIMRRGIEVGRGKMTNLQSQRADVRSVSEGMEFGAQIQCKADIAAGDIIEEVSMVTK